MNLVTDYTQDKPNIYIYEHKRISSYINVHIFNGNNTYPLQKYLFLLQNVKIIDLTNKTGKLVIANTKQDTDFINYLDSLNDMLQEILKEQYKTNFIKTMCYTKQKHFPITLNINTDNVLYFDNNNNQINKEQFDVTLNLSVLLEIDKIILNNNTYWINFLAKQIKITTLYDLSKSIFEITQPINVPVSPLSSSIIPKTNNLLILSSNNISEKHGIIKKLDMTLNNNTNNNNNNNNTNNNNNKPTMICLSPNILREQLSKMKNKKSILNEEEEINKPDKQEIINNQRQHHNISINDLREKIKTIQINKINKINDKMAQELNNIELSDISIEQKRNNIAAEYESVIGLI